MLPQNPIPPLSPLCFDLSGPAWSLSICSSLIHDTWLLVLKCWQSYIERVYCLPAVVQSGWVRSSLLPPSSQGGQRYPIHPNPGPHIGLIVPNLNPPDQARPDQTNMIDLINYVMLFSSFPLFNSFHDVSMMWRFMFLVSSLMVLY